MVFPLKILSPIDGSRQSEKALEYAVKTSTTTYYG